MTAWTTDGNSSGPAIVRYLMTDKGSVSSGTVTFDVSSAAAQKLTVLPSTTGSVTVAFSNWPAALTYGEVSTFLVNPSSNITLPSIHWYIGNGTTSTTFSDTGVTLQASGTNILVVWTIDGGTTLYGKAQ